MTDSKVALVDMDGTLCDYEGSLKKELSKCLSQDGVDIWDKKYKYLRDTIKRVPGFWKNMSIISNGWTVKAMLEMNGFDLHILTKGPHNNPEAWKEKLEWCRKNLGDVSVTITENKSLVYGRILFDDYPDYCESWLKHRPRGLVLMPAHSYNEGFDEEYPDQVVRVTGCNWDEVEDAIIKQKERK